jgi:peptidoglycan/LPS O-acetylase OafA/YrhL
MFAGLYWFARLGFLGVDLFFVLSGFIISYTYWQRFSVCSYNTYRSFLWARLARLYPVHLFTLIASALLLVGVRVSGFVGAKDFSTWTLGNFLANAMLVHAWRPHYIESWNNASWSVSCEWFAYLVFPLLVFIGLKKLSVQAVVMCVVLFQSIPIVFAQAGYLPPCILLVKVLCEFTAGCLMYHLYTRRCEYARAGKKLNYGVVAALASVLVLVWEYRRLAPDWLALVFPFVILAVAESSGFFGRLLGSKIAVYWGRVSYSLYMTHNVTLWLLKAFLPVHSGGAGILLFFVYIASISVVAVLTYHFVEEPARKWMRARNRGAAGFVSNAMLNKDVSAASTLPD